MTPYRALWRAIDRREETAGAPAPPPLRRMPGWWVAYAKGWLGAEVDDRLRNWAAWWDAWGHAGWLRRLALQERHPGRFELRR